MGLAPAAGVRVAVPAPGRPRLLPPVVAALLLAASAALHFAFPEMPRWRAPVAGGVLVVAGIGTMLWAARLFGREGTTVLPRASWRLLDPDLIHWRMEAADRDALLLDLLQVRLVL